MEFTSLFQVRFDECAADGAARASTLLRYTIEVAFAHSTAKGFPLAWYDARGLYWLVRRARLELRRPVPYGVRVWVTTRVVGFRRIWARRRNLVWEEGGPAVGTITMDWVFTDRQGSPIRVVPEMVQAFPPLAERFTVQALDLGIRPAGARRDDHVVPAHQADPRGHVNTAAYVDLFEDGLVGLGVATQQRPVVFDLEFLRQSVPGDTVSRSLWSASDAWRMDLTTPQGESIARGVRATA
jgi:acyl-CoA thioesterase FadM